MNNFEKAIKLGKLLNKRLVNSSKQKGTDLINNLKKKSNKIAQFVNTPAKIKIQNSLKFVDDTLGVSEVVEAQKQVSYQELDFLRSRDEVHRIKSILDGEQNLLNETRQKLDRIDRSDESYLSHVAEEHKILLQVKKLQRDYISAEEVEREKFSVFSSAVRLSHEKERSRAERTKYWSIIGSITGTIIGFMSSSLLTQYRMVKFQEITTNVIDDAAANVRQQLQLQTNALIHRFSSIPTELDTLGKPSISSQQQIPEPDIDNILKNIESLDRSLTQHWDNDTKTLHAYQELNLQMELAVTNLQNCSNKLEKIERKLSDELTRNSTKRDSLIVGGGVAADRVLPPSNFDQQLSSQKLNLVLSLVTLGLLVVTTFTGHSNGS